MSSSVECMGEMVDKPECGRKGTPSVDTPKSVVGAIVTGVLSIWGTIKGVIPFVEGTAATGAEAGFLAGTFEIIGIAAPVGIWLAAVAGALLTFTVVAVFYVQRCGSKNSDPGCSAGVVQDIVPSFNSAADEVFPFSAMHDRVDVVVRCVYWPVVSGGAPYVFCGNDTDRSPIMRGFYYSKEVCGAGKGALVGAGAGAVGGIVAGAAAGAAIGCATVVLCAVAIVAALLIAAVAVLVGALAGGQIGKAASEDSTPTGSTGEEIRVGDFVTRRGGLVLLGEMNNAKVYWFVEETHQNGRASSSPPYSYQLLDEEFTSDDCGS